LVVIATAAVFCQFSLGVSLMTIQAFAARDRAAELISAIRSDVLPRLLVAHGDEPTVKPSTFHISPATVEALAQTVLTGTVQDVSNAIRDQFKNGADLTAICLHLLSPTATLLGEMSESGRISFTEVATALATLEGVLRRLDDEAVTQVSRGWRPGSVLLASFPGDLHTFGLYMVEEFFHRDGWSVTVMPGATEDAILSEISSSFHHIVGLSIVNEPLRADLLRFAHAIRSNSMNPALKLMVGGSAIPHEADPVQFGIDAIVVDAPGSVAMARRWHDSLSS
jgi:MerR family transcriptional regulator, light-induced transcriptional regulator